MPTPILNETPWKGLNLGQEPERLEPGQLQSANDVVIDGGDLYTRPGYQGQLSALMGGGAIYGFTPFVSGGSSWAVFACGGKLYKWQFGATSATELLEGGLSLALTTAGVMAAAAPSFVYIVDGAGSLHRVDLTSSVAMTSLSTPSAPSGLSATGRVLDATSTASDWYDGRSGAGIAHGWIACDPTKTGELLANNGFDSVLAAGNWTAFGPNSATARNTGTGTMTPRGASTAALALTAPGDGASQKLSASGAAPPTMVVSAITNFTGAPQKIRIYRCELWIHSEDTANTSTVVVQVLAYLGGAVIGSTSYTASQAKQANGDKWVPHSFIASFADLDDDPDDLEVVLSAGYANTGLVYVDDVSLRAATLSLIPTLSDAGDQIEAQTYASITGASSGRAPGTPAPDNKVAGYTNRQYIFRTFSAAQDWSTYPTLSAKVTFPAGVLAVSPNANLRVALATVSGTLNYSPPGTWSEDGQSLVWNLQGIPAAARASVKYFVVEMVGDQVGGVGSGQTLFRLGPILVAGSLASGAAVWYRIMELDGSGDATLLDVPESDVSQATAQLVPTSDARMATVTIPARTNAAATHFALFRYGGTLIDPERGKFPLGFLVGILSWSQATFDFGGCPAAGSGTTPRAPANPNLKWTLTGANAGGVLIDNTPDGFLGNGQVAMEGREPASSISAPRHVALWDGRVWLTSGSAELYASWRTSTDRRAGLYFAKVYQPGPTDVHAAIRGWWRKLPLDTGDQIQAIVPLRDSGLGSLAVLTTQGLWLVTPAQIGYAVDRVPDAPGVVGPRAVLFAHEALWWLAPDGLWMMAGGSAKRVSDAIQGALPPLLDLTPSALALSSIVAWWRYLLVILPGATSDTYPTVALVWDNEEQAWTRWTGAAWTGGAALQSGGSLGRLIVTTRTGQIIAIGTAGGDKALSGDAAAGVAMSVRTRSVRSRNVQTPEEIGFDVKAGAAGSMTITVKGDTPAADSAATWTLASGDNASWLRPGRGATGRSLSLQLDATTVQRLRVRRLSLQASEGGM